MASYWAYVPKTGKIYRQLHPGFFMKTLTEINDAFIPVLWIKAYTLNLITFLPVTRPELALNLMKTSSVHWIKWEKKTYSEFAVHEHNNWVVPGLQVFLSKNISLTFLFEFNFYAIFKIMSYVFRWASETERKSIWFNKWRHVRKLGHACVCCYQGRSSLYSDQPGTKRDQLGIHDFEYYRWCCGMDVRSCWGTRSQERIYVYR